MADIDIGATAINRGAQIGDTRTLIEKSNPANASGTITSVEIWAFADIVDCEVATFYVVSGNNLSTRDTEYIGSVASGDKRTFEVNLDVEIGDYIGIYVYSTGRIEYDTSGGVGIWEVSGDQIPSSDVTFNYLSGRILSLYGTGIVPTYNYYGYNSS